MRVIRTAYAHPRRKFGGVDFTPAGRLAYFVGYHTCECGATSKILLSTDEIRQLRGKRKRPSLGRAIAKRVARYYGLRPSDLSL